MLKAGWDAIVHSMQGDKNKGWQDNLRCPYMLCPSNQPQIGSHKPRMKFMQKIQPTVYQYRCEDCHCPLNVSLETAENGRESFRINPALASGQPSYTTNWRR